MPQTLTPPGGGTGRDTAAGIAIVSSALLMTGLALTRIFSVTMYHPVAFLAISIALFGLSGGGVLVYVMRHRWAGIDTRELLTMAALLHGLATLVALAFLVRIRVGLDYSPENLALMLAIYVLAALPFLTGGGVISLAFARLAAEIHALYGAGLTGAAIGSLAVVPLLYHAGAPGAVIAAAALAVTAAVCFAPPRARRRIGFAGLLLLAAPMTVAVAGGAPFDVADTRGGEGDPVLFSKWNAVSRVAVYDRPHGGWSLSPQYQGSPGDSLVMDIDSAASTPILKGMDRPEDADYLRYELTSLAYHLVERPRGFSALVIGPGGGRDLLAALVFGASEVDGVEINPVIARDVMLDRFGEYSGYIYAHPRVSIRVDAGRGFLRRSSSSYDVIQVSLIDTWAATVAGAYTLTENPLYTVEAFGDYLERLSDGGILTITRWAFDGLRLVSLAQEASAARGLDAAQHLAVVRLGRLATVLFKKTPFTPDQVRQLQDVSNRLAFSVLYAPGVEPPLVLEEPIEMIQTGTSAADYRRLILAAERERFLAEYPLDIRPTSDDRPFFFHTTRPRDQLRVALGRSVPFGLGLGALLTLFGVSAVLLVLFILIPLRIGGDSPRPGWGGWLTYFAALGAGFMLIEVALVRQFAPLLGPPVYSWTVTLFSLLLGAGIGSLIGGRVPTGRMKGVTTRAILAVSIAALLAPALLSRLIDMAILWPFGLRVLVAAGVLVPLGTLLGVPLPGGIRLLAIDRAELVPWAWGTNAAFSVVGATLALFIAMNWGFSATLLAAAVVYGAAAATLQPSQVRSRRTQ